MDNECMVCEAGLTVLEVLVGLRSGDDGCEKAVARSAEWCSDCREELDLWFNREETEYE